MPGTFNSFPIDWQEPEVGARLEGDGSSSSPFNVKDKGIDNGALADVATETMKGRIAGGSGAPTDLTKSQVKTLLSIDDLVTLSGVADGAVNLGTFTGATIPDAQTIKAALQALETALEAITPGGASIETYSEESLVNSNNRVTVGYVVVSGTPTIDVVWTGEGGSAPSVEIQVSGGVVRVSDVFSTYENTDSASRNFDITINGVGDDIDRAVPIFQKIYHQFDFDTVSPSGQLYADNDNTPAVQPYGFDATSPGQISVRVTNIPSNERHGLNMIFKQA